MLLDSARINSVAIIGGKSTTASPSFLPGWHRGTEETFPLTLCEMMLMQKSILTVDPAIPAVQLNPVVLQVNVVRELVGLRDLTPL